MSQNEPPGCANCGGPVSTRGPRPRSGKRYCSAPNCVKKRNQQAHLARTGRALVDPEKQAPATCSNCAAPLPTRPWRSGDEFGRWCSRPKCRADRHQKRQAVLNQDTAATLARAEHLETVVDFLRDVIQADVEEFRFAERIHCKDCGLTSAILGWPHPADPEATTACLGTLGGREPRRIGTEGLIAAWPAPRTYTTHQEES